MKTMTPQEAGEILDQYNIWRRNDDDVNPHAMPDTRELGKAIEVAVNILKAPANEFGRENRDLKEALEMLAHAHRGYSIEINCCEGLDYDGTSSDAWENAAAILWPNSQSHQPERLNMSNETKNELRQPEGMGAETCSPSRRAVVCCFCGLAMSYDGQSPPETLMKKAMDHEKECVLNPYIKTIDDLHAAIRTMKNSKGRWNAQKACEALYSLLPENTESIRAEIKS